MCVDPEQMVVEEAGSVKTSWSRHFSHTHQVFNIPADRQEVRKTDRKQAAERRELLLNVCFLQPPPGGLKRTPIVVSFILMTDVQTEGERLKESWC